MAVDASLVVELRADASGYLDELRRIGQECRRWRDQRARLRRMHTMYGRRLRCRRSRR